MELSEDWKLIITDSSPRIVHARGCDYIKDWVVDGSLELYKVRPEKHKICRTCENLVYATIGAKDYNKNLKTYKRIFKDVPPKTLRYLFEKRHAKCKIIGERIYFKIKQDVFYIDFSFNEVRLFHANYKVAKREQGKDFGQGGYHEHNLSGYEMKDALEYLAFYDFDKATEVHKKKRKRPRMTLSEYDPELYGFS